MASYPNLTTPHRLKSLAVRAATSCARTSCQHARLTRARLQGVKIRLVAAGPTACMCIAVSTEGECYTWGRNEARPAPAAAWCLAALGLCC